MPTTPRANKESNAIITNSITTATAILVKNINTAKNDIAANSRIDRTAFTVLGIFLNRFDINNFLSFFIIIRMTNDLLLQKENYIIFKLLKMKTQTKHEKDTNFYIVYKAITGDLRAVLV